MSSAASTNSEHIAMLVANATAILEAMILGVCTDLMARAGWVLLGSSRALLVHTGAGRPEVAVGCGQVLTKNGEVEVVCVWREGGQRLDVV